MSTETPCLTESDRARLACSLITDLIDNGEFIHGYQMYLCLERQITKIIPSSTARVWTTTYIDLLSSMGFYRKAAHTTKHSSASIFEGMNQKQTFSSAKCAHCRTDLEPMAEGSCAKCNKSRSCSICLRTVKGLNLWCQVCAHGGHFHDIKKWFSTPGATCATGCGHMCFKFYSGL